MRKAVLIAAGVSPEAVESRVGRIPADAFGALWRSVTEAIDDEFFSLDSRAMKSGSYALLCRALMGERTVRGGLCSCLSGLRLLLDDISAEMVQTRSMAIIQLNTERVSTTNKVFAAEMLITMIYGIVCWLAGRRIPILKVEFDFPRPYYAAEYLDWLSDALVFDAPATRVSLDAQWLDAPVIANAHTLDEFLGNWPRSMFEKFRSPPGWASRIRRLLRNEPAAQWPDIVTLARTLNVAPATLQRRLVAEGTNYSAIKAELRHDAAVRLLSTTDMPVYEIAERLGYQEISAFHRAFRQWSGRPPQEYRLAIRSLEGQEQSTSHRRRK